MLTNRLKEEREARHLTQEAVGNALSLDPNTIYRYETGRRCPTLEQALRLSKYYEKSVNELFHLEPKEI